jgi:tRNA(Ile2) C34 agmatinyltransferase TiaS
MTPMYTTDDVAARFADDDRELPPRWAPLKELATPATDLIERMLAARLAKADAAAPRCPACGGRVLSGARAYCVHTWHINRREAS